MASTGFGHRKSHVFRQPGYLMRLLTDRASRAGVVINTMDVRGLKAQRGVSRFTDPGNEATSALFGGANGGGRAISADRRIRECSMIFDRHDVRSPGTGLLADATGGVTAINTDNFSGALDKIMTRSSTTCSPIGPARRLTENFTSWKLKSAGAGAKIYSRVGYHARADTPAKDLTKEQAIVRAAVRHWPSAM